MNPLMARAPMALPIYGSIEGYPSGYIRAMASPVDDGYCYLKMLHPQSWERVSRILGPNPAFHFLFAVAMNDVSIAQLARLQFCEVGVGKYHLREGDGTAMAVVVRSSTKYRRVPVWITQMYSNVPENGLVIDPFHRIGGSDAYRSLMQKADRCVQKDISRHQPVMPVVYMARDAKNCVPVENKSVSVESNLRGISASYQKFTINSGKRDAALIVPGNVAVQSGHVQVGGRGQSFALMVPANKEITVYRFQEADLIDPAEKVAQSVAHVAARESVNARDLLSSDCRCADRSFEPCSRCDVIEIASSCGGLKLRAIFPTETWLDSYAALDRYQSDHRFGLSHGNEFYVHRWKNSHEFERPVQNALSDGAQDELGLFKDHTCVHVAKKGLYGSRVDLQGRVVAISDTSRRDGSFLPMVFNDLVVTLGDRAKFSFAMEDVYRVSSELEYGFYGVRAINSPYAYDCYYGHGLGDDDADDDPDVFEHGMQLVL